MLDTRECDDLFLTAKRLRLFLGALLVLQIASGLGCLPYVHRGYIDYRTFYTAGRMVASGQSAHLYDYDTEQRLQSAFVTPDVHALPFMSPPYTALLFAPLSRTGFRSSYLIFFFLNLLFAGLAVTILLPRLPSLSARWAPAPALLFLSFLPLGIALMFGQLSIALLLIYCVCFAALEDQRPFLAGLILSLALVKFQIALPVALLFLVWRRWRFVAGFLSGALSLAIISIHLTGRRILMAYAHSLFDMSRKISTTAAQSRYAIFPVQMPNLFGLFHFISKETHWATLLTAACSLIVLGWAMTQRPSLPLALLAGLLVSYHLYIYDLTLLLLPISMFADRQCAVPRSRGASQATDTGAFRIAEWRTSGAVYATACLLIAPIARFLIAWNVIYLLAIPVAALFVGLGDVGAIPREEAGHRYLSISTEKLL
jgi:hypothetical protein